MTTDDFLWVGTRGQIEERLIPDTAIRLETIEGGAIAGVSWREKIGNMAKLIGSIGKTNQILGQFNPDVVFLTGGYVNGPVTISAWLRRIPIAIYLPDIEPGLAIKSLSRFARRVACTTPDSLGFFAPGKAVVTGYPIRADIEAARTVKKDDALSAFELQGDRPTLLVFGGSRGARSINRALIQGLPELLATIQIVHISGTLDWPEVEAAAEKLTLDQKVYYRPYPYLHQRMALAFRAADLVLARAGASMLAEGPAFGLPAILVPYPYAWRYQKVNADYLAENGAAVRLDDETLTETIGPTVLGLIKDQTRLNRMSEAAAALYTPEAAENLADILIGLAKRAVP